MSQNGIDRPSGEEQQNGFTIVAIDKGPTVIDNGDPCSRCDARRTAGDLSYIIEYAHGELKDVCSDCACELEVGAVDTKEAPVLPDGGRPSNVVSKGKYGDVQIDPGELGNSYERVGDDLKAKVHPNGRLYLRVRDSDDGRRWNEFSVPLGGEFNAE